MPRGGQKKRTYWAVVSEQLIAIGGEIYSSEDEAARLCYKKNSYGQGRKFRVMRVTFMAKPENWK